MITVKEMAETSKHEYYRLFENGEAYNVTRDEILDDNCMDNWHLMKVLDWYVKGDTVYAEIEFVY